MEKIKIIKKIPLIAMIIMGIVSFSSLLGLNIAGMSVLIGIVFFFINKAVEKQSFMDSGLDIKVIKDNFKDKKIWIWIMLPLTMDAICIIIAKLFLPQFIDHILARSQDFLSFDKNIVLVFQLAFLALGEEIGWRALFQNQLSKVLPIIPVLLISSVLFAFGHLTKGNIIIVIYDIFFIFINSIIYGIIFHKTNNAWISAISHFIANLFSIIVLLFL